MSFWGQVWRRLFAQDEPTPEMTQTSREALVDLLVLAMLIDDRPHEAEWDEVREIVSRLGWSGERSWELYVSEAAERADQVRGDDEGKRAWCSSIRDRLPSEQLREHALRQVFAVISSDGVHDAPELELISLLADIFSIPAERVSDLLTV